ncbi:cytochrome P450 2K1 [Amia ocellicauda]|uniref:cytochrome P450 2K1 n=1 Tax=Amia ocellicauda TaxID=2972642 RepID=UPI0034649C80
MSVIAVLLANTVTVSLVFILTIASFFYLLFKPSKSAYRFPPGPAAWPVIGNLNILDLKKPHETLCQLSEKYGNVFTFHMGRDKYLVLTGYETVKEALVNRADDFGERGLTRVSTMFGKGTGVVFGSGESWKTMRRFTLSTLRDFGMGKRTIEDRIVEEAQCLLDVFESHKGDPFDPIININSAVSNVICTIVFGDRFDYSDPQFLRLQQLVNQNVKLVTSPAMRLYDISPFLGSFLANFKKLSSNVLENRTFFSNYYHERKDIVDRNDLRSFIDTFIVKQQEEKAKNPNTYFHEMNMVSTAMNLFAAGTETTSTTLRWGLLMMMKYPHIQEKVHAEIQAVIGKERPPRVEDRKDMPYTDAVLHEIQRFANVVPMNLLHQTKSDIDFKGYRIPKGTPVIPLLTSVLFDKNHWETPHKFNPQHFLDAQGKFVKREAFMPFSAGRRVCLGETLAKMELFLFFTLFLQRFKFSLPPGICAEDVDLSPTPGLTNAPNPYKLCAIRQ